MSKRVLTTALLGLAVIGSIESCQRPVAKSFLETQHLKGKVKHIDESFYPIEEKDGQPQKGKLFFRAVYDIDSKGNKVSWKEYNEDGILKWKAISKYEGAGREIECLGYNAAGALDWKSVYQYDEKGNRTQEEEYGATGSKEYKIIFKYDEKGVKTGREFYTADGALYSRSAYQMDADGNEIQEDVYDGGNNLKTTNTSHYEQLDAQGNWLVQTQYANGTFAMIAEREIEYY